MYDPELERIRRQRMLELQRRLQQEQEIQRQLAQAQLKALLQRILSKDAYERLGRVKMASPELYARAVQAIVYLYQAGRISGKLSDAQLKALLERLRGKRREPRIKIMEK